jgi:hypothetical protein
MMLVIKRFSMAKTKAGPPGRTAIPNPLTDVQSVLQLVCHYYSPRGEYVDQLVSTILDYSVQLLATVAFAVFVVTVRSGLSYLSAKIGDEKVNMAARLAVTVVRALEQQGELLGFDGPQKKEMAILTLRQLFAKFNIELSLSSQGKFF